MVGQMKVESIEQDVASGQSGCMGNIVFCQAQTVENTFWNVV